MTTVRSLSFHAHYRCGHSGVCCTSNWPIPIEADRFETMKAALANGHLRPVGGTSPFETPEHAPDDTAARLTLVDGRCIFFDASNQLCRVHDALGHDALPLACRQFPRIVVHDPRGVSVALSHYCPTAAGLLGADQPVTIVESPEAFPRGAEYVGLEASDAVPPLVRPGVLMDWDSWWEFERCAVALIAHAPGPLARVLSRLQDAVERVRSWNPGEEPLTDRVQEAFAPRASPPGPLHIDFEARIREVVDSVTETYGFAGAGVNPTSERQVRHFLAAHAFANWTAHLGDGLRTWLRSIEAAYAMVASGRYDIRAADLYLRHLTSPNSLARVWSETE